MFIDIPDSLPVLSKGNWDPGSGKACIMDAISIISGKPQEEDRPSCVHPMLRPLFINVNDTVPDNVRHNLWPLGLRAMGTGVNPLDVEDEAAEDNLQNNHIAARVMLALARKEYGGSARMDDHRAAKSLPHLLAWVQNPTITIRKRLYSIYMETFPVCCQGCSYLLGAIEATQGWPDSEGIRFISGAIAKASDEKKFEILSTVLDLFERVLGRAKPDTATAPPTVDWDQLREELGAVTVRS